MKINKTLNGDELLVAVQGRLDTMSAPMLEEELEKDIEQVKSVVFDMKELEYISSAGLRSLLKFKKQLHNKGNIKLINTNSIVKEVFEVTGFIDLLDIE